MAPVSNTITQNNSSLTRTGPRNQLTSLNQPIQPHLIHLKKIQSNRRKQTNKQITQFTQPIQINNIQTVTTVPVKERDVQLNVVLYDEGQNLYLETTHKFIVTPIDDKVKIIGKLFDNKIIPLDRNDKVFACGLGLVVEGS